MSSGRAPAPALNHYSEEEPEMLKVIWDDGTPRCLPRWACDEIVRHRLRMGEVDRELLDLKMQLAEARGEDPGPVLREHFKAFMATYTT